MALWEERRDHEMAVRRNVEAENARYAAWDGNGVCPECHDERFVAAGSHTARCPTCSEHEMRESIWEHEHKHKIINRIQYSGEVAVWQLREIARIIGYVEAK